MCADRPPGASDPRLDRYRQRIRELEARLEQSEGTLDAIRRGDAVAGGMASRVHTRENADNPYRVLIEQIQEGAVTLSEDGTVRYCNHRLAELLRTPRERVIGQRLAEYVLASDRDDFARLLRSALEAGARGELTLRDAEGARIPVYLSVSALRQGDGASLLCGVVSDLTQQKLHLRELAEANRRLLAEGMERGRIEDALRQSQKMEAVGQLTGGLAHDFNNLLTGIAGSLEMLQTRMAQGRLQDLGRYIAAAQGASKRAAALTHRLLAFSRRQTLEPKAADINRLIAGMEELIRRTVGPAIAVEVVAAGGLWTTLVDPNQLENALLNLCINARDAMPDGGRLTIETGNRWLDPPGGAERELPPGQYVSLNVSDTGTGMSASVIERAFDPFFTTKPIGQGTGLGLSMIYGFARQSGGQVRIYSEPGQGATVCLYLPRHLGDALAGEGAAEPASTPRAEQGETVLIVDDEPTVRMLVGEVLQDFGYTALEAADGASGLRVLRSDVRIDLLITDVGLPGGINGRQVADAGRVLRPRLKVLFITGYAENAVIGHGHLEPGMHVLTKPFMMDALAKRIRDLIAQA